MNRNGLVIAAIVLLGAMLGLWLYMRKGDVPTPIAERTDAGSAVVVGSRPAPQAPSLAPSLPGTGSDPGSGSDARDYVVGGMRVRDHRAGDQQKVDIPPNVHPLEGRQLPSELTHAIGQQIKAVMQDCAASVPREARGPAPRLEGQVIVAIKDHKMSVTEATMQLRDVVGAAVEPTKACIEQKSLGLQTAAAGQEDMERYSINITFAMP